MYDSMIDLAKQQIQKDTIIHDKKLNDAKFLKKSVSNINQSTRSNPLVLQTSKDSVFTDKDNTSPVFDSNYRNSYQDSMIENSDQFGMRSTRDKRRDNRRSLVIQ